MDNGFVEKQQKMNQNIEYPASAAHQISAVSDDLASTYSNTCF